jgi:hypothetical protein
MRTEQEMLLTRGITNSQQRRGSCRDCIGSGRACEVAAGRGDAMRAMVPAACVLVTVPMHRHGTDESAGGGQEADPLVSEGVDETSMGWACAAYLEWALLQNDTACCETFNTSATNVIT